MPNSALSQEELNWAQLAALIEASNLLNASLDHEEVLRQLMTLVARGVNADRATLYLLDEQRGELRSIVLLDERLQEIRLPLAEGLAGYVARTGETVNVADAYADPRFNPRIDQQAEFRTRTVLTVPMRDPQGRINGVVQALNKQQGLFTEGDELYLMALAEQAALALENAFYYADMIANCQRLQFLYRINNLMASETPLRDLLGIVIQATADELQAETGSILLRDPRSDDRLVFLTATDEKAQDLLQVAVPLEGSIAGWILQHEQAVIVNKVRQDPRFYPGADEQTGYVTRTLVGAPMQVLGRTIGVLEVLNKRAGGQFSEADLQLVQAVANYAALAMESTRQPERPRQG